jgi:predicted RNA binding protein YcfA (HicA-like mRNA interferase family)
VPRKARDVKRALTSKGFREEKRDHSYYFLVHDGQKISAIYTKISHNDTEITDNLISQMAKQIRLNTAEFYRFIDCTLTARDYVQKLANTGHL